MEDYGSLGGEGSRGWKRNGKEGDKGNLKGKEGRQRIERRWGRLSSDECWWNHHV